MKKPTPKPEKPEADSLIDQHGFDAVMRGLLTVPKGETENKPTAKRRRKAKKKRPAK